VVIGAVAAVLVGAVTFITGVKRPDAISQTYDAIFHYNAVRYIEQTGKASPLGIGTLGQPGGKGTFYPDAWHAMAALLAELTGASIPVAATVTCLVIAVLVWPLSCLLLARHLFGGADGRAAAAVVITGMLSSLFGAFPWVLIGTWGVLWPNALGLALAPAGVALGMSAIRVSESDTFGPVRRWLFGAAGAWAIAIAHPNSAFSVFLICLFPLFAAVGPYVVRQWTRHTLVTTVTLLGLLVLVAIASSLAFTHGPLRVMDSQRWPLWQTPQQAVLSAFNNSTNGMVAAEWILAAFLVIGAVTCFVWRQRRWLVWAELVIAALYVGSTAIGSNLTRPFTGLWYNDSYRFAATLPIVAIPLITTGVLAAGAMLYRAASRAPVAARPALAVGFPLAVGAVIATATAFQNVPSNMFAVGRQFSSSGVETFVSPAKLQFLKTVARLVPASALVADDPFAGSAYLYTIAGTRVLFPYAGVAGNNRNVAYLARNLVHLKHDPLACTLVHRYGVGYMIVIPDDRLNTPHPRSFYGTGVTYPAPDSGFRLMTADGPLRLYKITICQPTTARVAEAASGGSS
jgi:hypothetical protein